MKLFLIQKIFYQNERHFCWQRFLVDIYFLKIRIKNNRKYCKYAKRWIKKNQIKVVEFFLLCLLQKSNKLNLVSKYLLSVNSNTTRPINWICSSDTRITPRWFSICFIGDRSFSAQAKFSENLTFLTPWHADVRVRIRGKEMLIFRKSFRTY